MSITLKRRCLLIVSINAHAVDFSEATGVDSCRCPIYVEIVYRYSLVCTFLNWVPISASIYDASTFSLFCTRCLIIHLVVASYSIVFPSFIVLALN